MLISRLGACPYHVYVNLEVDKQYTYIRHDTWFSPQNQVLFLQHLERGYDMTQYELSVLKRLTLNIQKLNMDDNNIEETITDIIDCIQKEENIYSS